MAGSETDHARHPVRRRPHAGPVLLPPAGPAMSVRHLDSLFRPASIALVGASDRPGSLGSVVLRNLRQGGFAGPVWAVNRRHAKVGGEPAWRDIDSLPTAPDLAILCTPAAG